MIWDSFKVDLELKHTEEVAGTILECTEAGSIWGRVER